MRSLVLTCLWGVVSYVGFSQATPIYLNNETVYPAPLAAHARTTIEWPTNNCEGEHCYAILQFYELPTDDELLSLEAMGIVLHDYIPDLAYLASATGNPEGSLPTGVYAIQPISPVNKRPPGPLAIAGGAEGEEAYDLIGIPFPAYTTAQLAQKLDELGAQIVGIDEKRVELKIDPALLPELLSCPLLQYTESKAAEPVPEGRLGRTSGRVQQLNHGNGWGYDGEGVAIAIADDGEINHLDFINRVTDFTIYHTGDHADMTAGMAVGAGNINPIAAGMAPAASLYLYDISSYDHIEEAPENYEQYGVVITSTSFGEGCGDSYNLATQSIDAQVYEHPYLLHFYSAGNHGTDACYNQYSSLGPTQEGYYFSTITGGRKAGKNVMAVGNAEYDDHLRITSSRGPTPDGRIKPDITSMGQGDLTTDADNEFRLSSGTSAASPNAAGASAGLYQYYREAHQGQDPSSALIKAVMLNTAEDLGTPGPDYSYGWGRLHAGRALETLQQDHYFTGSIQHNQQMSYPLAVPAGVERLRIMVYWHDPAGSTLSSRALVNDLDMKLELPDGQQQLPWTPSYAANLDSLILPALHREDHVNNMEQVVIDQPEQGVYLIRLKGHLVPEGPQEFYVVYHLETEDMKLTFPYEGATLVPTEQNVIQWDAIGEQGTFSLAYSLDNGTEWQGIADNIAADQRHYLWTTPSTPGDDLLVRLSRNGTTITSDGPAIVAATPDFTVEYENDFQALISWDAVPGAVGYEVLRLGQTRMEVIDSTGDLQISVPAELSEFYWFSVQAVMDDGGRGRRALAQRYQHFGCNNEYNLVIQFDQYPGETSWVVLDASGNTMKQGGPYVGYAPHSQVSVPICLPPGCYTFVMLDAYGDGICCENGDGWFNLYSAQGNSLLSGGDFSNLSYGLFCPDQSDPPLQITLENRQHVSCFGGQDGAIQIGVTGGDGTYSYQWSNGATSSGLSFLGAGTYTVTVNDGAQTASQSVTVIQPLPLQMSHAVTPSICNDGAIQLTASGGTAPYQVVWADGGQGWQREGLAPGSYFPILTDDNGCLTSGPVQVTGGAPIEIQLAVTNPFCSSAEEGSIVANVSGGHGNYSFQWSNGQQGPAASGLGAGQYEVTVTDQGACQAEAIAIISTPQEILVTAQTQAPSCSGAADGTILPSVSGGNGGFQFNWSDGSQEPVRLGLTAGVYVLTITDASGCSTVRGYQLQEPDPLSVQTSTNLATQEVGGLIHLNVSGGTGPYFVQWDHGPTGQLLYNVPAGDYTATVTDSQGCQFSVSASVLQQEPGGGSVTLNYCEVQGSSTTYEWIESVILNGSSYWSGNDDGYGDFTAFQIPLAKDVDHSMELVPGYSGAAYHENWRVWIDFNQDGDFDEWNEQVVAHGPTTGSAVLSISVPEEALTGQTRMRIAMQYGLPPNLCNNVTYGEVEDYVVVITDGEEAWDDDLALRAVPGISANDTPAWQAYPNPVSDRVRVQGQTSREEWVALELYDIQGRRLYEQREWSEGALQTEIMMGDWPAGVYLLQIIGDDWSETVRLVKR